MFYPNANGRGLYHGTTILNVNNLIYVLLINLFKKRLEDTKADKKCQRGNQNPYFKRRTDNTMAKRKKDKQRSTKHIYTTKDRVTRTQLKPGGELRCSGRVSSSFSTCGEWYDINLVTNPVISREWGKCRGVNFIKINFLNFKCF